jgi:hypothetical protein
MYIYALSFTSPLVPWYLRRSTYAATRRRSCSPSNLNAREWSIGRTPSWVLSSVNDKSGRRYMIKELRKTVERVCMYVCTRCIQSRYHSIPSTCRSALIPRGKSERIINRGKSRLRHRLEETDGRLQGDVILANTWRIIRLKGDEGFQSSRTPSRVWSSELRFTVGKAGQRAEGWSPFVLFFGLISAHSINSTFYTAVHFLNGDKRISRTLAECNERRERPADTRTRYNTIPNDNLVITCAVRMPTR